MVGSRFSPIPPSNKHVKVCQVSIGKMGGKSKHPDNILNMFFQDLTKIGSNLKDSQD